MTEKKVSNSKKSIPKNPLTTITLSVASLFATQIAAQSEGAIKNGKETTNYNIPLTQDSIALAQDSSSLKQDSIPLSCVLGTQEEINEIRNHIMQNFKKNKPEKPEKGKLDKRDLGCHIVYNTYTSTNNGVPSSSISGTTQVIIENEFQDEPNTTEINNMKQGLLTGPLPISTYVGSAFDPATNTLSVTGTNGGFAKFNQYLINNPPAVAANFSILTVPVNVTLLGPGGIFVAAFAFSGGVGDPTFDRDPSSGRHGMILTTVVVPEALIHEIAHLLGLDHTLDGSYMDPTPAGATWFNQADKIDLSTSADAVYPLGYDPSDPCLDSNIYPIELKEYSAKYDEKQKQVDVERTTSSELNNDYFKIYRSTNFGHERTELGEIDSQGSGGIVENNYKFTDQNPKPGYNMYKLMQTDLDGKTEEIFKTTVNTPLDITEVKNTYRVGDVIKVGDIIKMPEFGEEYDMFLINIAGRIVTEVDSNEFTCNNSGLHVISVHNKKNGENRHIKIIVY